MTDGVPRLDREGRCFCEHLQPRGCGVQFREGASNWVDTPFLQATTFEHEHEHEHERRTPNAERRAPNAERRTPNAERRTPNAKRLCERFADYPRLPSLLISQQSGSRV